VLPQCQPCSLPLRVWELVNLREYGRAVLPYALPLNYVISELGAIVRYGVRERKISLIAKRCVQ